MDVALQYGAISISWFIVIWLLSTAITFEPTVPDVICWVGGVNNARCIREQGSILVHIFTPPIVTEIKRTQHHSKASVAIIIVLHVH